MQATRVENIWLTSEEYNKLDEATTVLMDLVDLMSARSFATHEGSIYNSAVIAMDYLEEICQKAIVTEHEIPPLG